MLIMPLCRVDLMQLVEEATEGCWIGHRARMFTSEIGSVYSPPKQGQATAISQSVRQVETVIDIGQSEQVMLSSFSRLNRISMIDLPIYRAGYSNARRVAFDACS